MIWLLGSDQMVCTDIPYNPIQQFSSFTHFSSLTSHGYVYEIIHTYLKNLDSNKPAIGAHGMKPFNTHFYYETKYD